MQTSWTWCKLKPWHVQFKILDRATPLASLKDAEKYRDLIVRIEDYSASFVDPSAM
jgi:formate C-acetyltransferase